eukprot:7960779-Pyramimonas_sp.AAC.2
MELSRVVGRVLAELPHGAKHPPAHLPQRRQAVSKDVQRATLVRLILDCLQQPCQCCIVYVLPLWYLNIRHTVSPLAVVRCAHPHTRTCNQTDM